MDELNHAVEQLLGRYTGFLQFRLAVQPILALVLAIRAGIKDARENQPAFLWEFVKNPLQRRQLLHSAWKDIGRVMIAAFVLDAVYQVIVLKFFYLLQALIVVFVLAVFPYILTRGPVTRISRRFKTRA